MQHEPIGGYQIVAPLGAGGMGAVFRARHQQTGNAVALKIALKTESIAVDSVRREIRLLGRIRHPGVVSIIDHGVHELRPWYAMELIEGEALADMIGRIWQAPARSPPDLALPVVDDHAEDRATRPMRGATLPGMPDAASPRGAPIIDEPPARADRWPVAAGHLPEVLQVFARLCQTLGYLHGEGIVHLDLKPTNVLLRAGGQPVVLDFGITRQIAGGLNREVLNVDALRGGTELYMAPEQIVAGSTDARTDLYGLGCILYEALTGRPPFLRTGLTSVGEQHMRSPPRAPSEFVTGLPDELDRGVLQLLAKRPEKRMGYAGDLLELLCRNGAHVDPELAVRKPKPYLYRPRLIGRELLMDDLRRELDRAQKGAGRCVFLMGPSGGGKTRVAMELGREAFAADMRVVSGECAPVTLSATAPEASAGRPLHPFQSMLSTVVDLCNAGGPETTAALIGDALPVLENLEPALARVAGRDRFPQTLAMSAAGAYGRMEQALSATIVATARLKPLLLVIDDLQWADALSQAVIRALASIDGKCHACVLVTCRSDEVKPEVAELSHLPWAVRYDLGPLEKPDVAGIIAGMLAHDDAPPALVEFIGDHSGGNPFFVAEYLQAAVSAGQLKRDPLGRWALTVEDGHLHLPESPAALLSLRVKDLDTGSRGLLEMAAVLGRAFSRNMLRHGRPGGPRPTFEEMEELIHRGILVEDGPEKLRFTHDKLREATYAEISEERRRDLHRIAADEVKASEPQRTLVGEFEHEALLTHHYRSAGMSREHFHHATRAGDLANRVGAHQQASELLHEALELSRLHPEVAQGLSKLEIAKLWGTYGAVLENLGRVDAGVPALERGLKLLDHPMPDSGFKLAAFVLTQLGRHLVQQVLPMSLLRTSSASRPMVTEAAETAAALARGYVGTNRQLNVIGAVLLSANLAERSDADGPSVNAYSFLGGIAGLLGLRRVALGYFGRARAAAQRDGTLEAALALAQLEGFYYMSRAEWARATAPLLPVLERSLATSALHLAEPPLLMLNYIHMLQGDLERAGEYINSLLEIARKTGNERFFLVGSLALSLHELYRGNFRPALARLESLHERVLAFDEFIHIANFHATRAGLLSWLGRHAEAVEFADRAVDVLADTGTGNALLYNVHAFTPETYLRAWSQAITDGTDPTALAERARRAVTASLQFSRGCEYAKPLALRFRGQAYLLDGKSAAGVRALEKSIAMAGRQGNLYEEAMAARALANVTSIGEGERAHWSKRASERLVRLGHRGFVEQLPRAAIGAAEASAVIGAAEASAVNGAAEASAMNAFEEPPRTST